MRIFLLAAAFPLACLAAGQTTSTHVTYTARATRAGQVVKELGALAKVSLEVSPQTENEVLVISVKDVPLSDVMARIATVTSGEWKQEGSVYRLIGSAVLRNQEERSEFAKHVARVKAAIATRIADEEKAKKAMAKMQAEALAKANAAAKGGTPPTKKTGDEDADDTPDFGGFVSPEEETITTLLSEIDPSTIAQIESGDRIVFSTEPTRTQRAMGGDAIGIINEFIQKHDSTITGVQPDLPDQFQGMSEQQISMMKLMMKKQNSKIGQASKALLVVSSSSAAYFGLSKSLQLELRIYDAKGGISFSGTSQLEIDGNDFIARMRRQAQEAAEASISGKPVQPGKKDESEPTTHTPIELSEDSKALQQLTKGFQGAKFTFQVSRELHQKLFLPSMYDPLSFLETDEVMAYAKSKGKPLVADLPDGSSSMFNTMGGEEAVPTLESFGQQLAKGATIVSVQDDSFVVIKPATPAEARTERLDRVALTALMQATEQKGVPSLDDMCAYAQAAPNPMLGGVAQMYVFLFVPGAISMGLDGMTSWDMLRFYGQMPAEARANLANGGKIAMGALSGAQHALAERMTYGADSDLAVDDPNHKPEEDMPAWFKIAGMGGGTDYKTEPTEVVPNGLPADGYIELKGTSEPFAAPVPGPDSSVMGMLGVLGPEELAMFKMFRTTQGAEQVSAMLPKFPQLHVGERSILNFTFHLAPQVSMKQSLKDHHLGKDSNTYSEDNLPADFQKRVADRAEALKKSPLGSIGGFMGNAGGGIHP